MASTINASTTLGLISTADTSGVLQLQTANTAALTIDASQNVGIGTASPAYKLDVQTAAGRFQVRDLGGSSLKLMNSTTGGNIGIDSAGGITLIYANGTETSRFDSSGNFMVGTTSPPNVANKNITLNSNSTDVAFALTLSDVRIGQLYAASSEVRLSAVTSVPLTFRTADTERMRLDSAGNLGLGVTPYASTGVRAFDLANYGALNTWDDGTLSNIQLGMNFYQTGSTFKYKVTSSASMYRQRGNVHSWFNAPSGTADSTITFTQAMTLDGSGNLGLGATSISAVGAYRVLDLNHTTGGYLSLSSAGTRIGALYGSSSVVGLEAIGASSPIQFVTNNAERARITSSGYAKFSNDGVYTNSTSVQHEFNQAANDDCLVVNATNASFSNRSLIVRATRNTTNASYYFIGCYNNTAAAFKMYVADSGNLTNTNGSYGTISDAKMKTDIVDAGSQWADVKAIRFRKFKMKDDPEQRVQLGVIAQEIEQTSAGLVEEHKDTDADNNDLGTTTKSVKTSILLMKAAVALQEAMTRIEQLEADVAALKGN